MTLKDVVKSTQQHVVRATKSLDFMSNSTKYQGPTVVASSSIKMLNNDELTHNEPTIIQSTRVPVHPFLQLSETTKLLSFLKKKLKTPVLHKATLTNGEEVFSNEAVFSTHKDLLRFLDSHADELYDLEVIELSPAEPLLYDEQVILQVETELGDVNKETLSTLLDTKITNSSNHLFTNDLKLRLVIEQHSLPGNIDDITRTAVDYMVHVDNATIAADIAKSLLPRLESLVKSRNSLLELTQLVYGSLSTNYPIVEDDLELKTLYLNNLISSKEPELSFNILTELQSCGYAPPRETMANYLALLAKKVNYHDKKSNVKSLVLLQGLQSVIFSTLSTDSARNLLLLCEHPDEISSVLDLVESTSPSEIPQVFQELEATVAKKLFASKSVRLSDASLKMSIIHRLQTHIENISINTKKLILFDQVNCGLFILPRQLLSQVELTSAEVESLKKKVNSYKMKNIDVVENSFPGRDLQSRRDFIKALEEI
ncbi:unnamed protein product [Cyberlindnera jadinii]|uniref:ATPase expression protein 1 n=1 Tax=Cyberlindnera jadinii (strain ATCC 18201 / CBS 1600 / BCRC 20928 / JCM 3617 / NBRC 0987 / NRRL Y-1542) TaxID=983966 RepID=A0A0H5C1P5_CYBJN|nr:unnamed protein product [Cyberlindnera jadinii]